MLQHNDIVRAACPHEGALYLFGEAHSLRLREGPPLVPSSIGHEAEQVVARKAVQFAEHINRPMPFYMADHEVPFDALDPDQISFRNFSHALILAVLAILHSPSATPKICCSSPRMCLLASFGDSSSATIEK